VFVWLEIVNNGLKSTGIPAGRIRVSPIVADHTKYWLLPACSKETKRRVAFFPGSTIGNFSPREVQYWFGLLWFNIPGKTLN
jgi:uncharacterized SAM-dependent methyltransferase